MLRHQLRQNLVLGLHLLLQELNPLLLVRNLPSRTLFRFKCRRAILEELLLPTVENRGLQPLFFAELGNRHLVDEMASEDSHFLCSRVMLTFVFHTFSDYLNRGTLSPFSAEAEQEYLLRASSESYHTLIADDGRLADHL